MDAPEKRGRGRPPEGALVLTTVADEREDSELLFDAMTDIHRGFERLRALQARRGLRRVRWIPANSPVLDTAA